MDICFLDGPMYASQTRAHAFLFDNTNICLFTIDICTLVHQAMMLHVRKTMRLEWSKEICSNCNLRVHSRLGFHNWVGGTSHMGILRTSAYRHLTMPILYLYRLGEWSLVDDPQSHIVVEAQAEAELERYAGRQLPLWTQSIFKNYIRLLDASDSENMFRNYGNKFALTQKCCFRHPAQQNCSHLHGKCTTKHRYMFLP